MDFLPNDYELPKTGGGNYTKLKQGTNKLRILSSPVLGYIRWEDKKPLRTRSRMTPECRHFWAVKVYNHDTKAIEVWEITQASIQESLVNLSRGLWGDPKQYDVEVTRSGQDLDTRYQVTTCKPEALPTEAQELSVDTPVNLDALFDGGDPFAKDDLPFKI